MATLEDFLRGGGLGPLHFGMTPEEVRAILGPPQDTASVKRPLIWKYGALQLTFKRVEADKSWRLAHMGIYFQNRESIPESVRPTDWLPTSDTTETQFRTCLPQQGLSVYGTVEGVSGRNLILATGAQATFQDDKLQSLQFTNRRPAVELSIPVPSEILTALRAKARESNRSVVDLCAAWIAEKASAAG